MAPRGANFTLQNADFLLVLGSRLDMGVTGYQHDRFARGARKVIVDLDRAEIGKLEMNVDLPVCADVGEFLREFRRQSGSITHHDRGGWLTRCRQWKAEYPVVLPEHWAREDGVSTYCLTDVLSEQTGRRRPDRPRQRGHGGRDLLLGLPREARAAVLSQPRPGGNGFGLPASIGGCLASHRRRTVCLEGDGGIQLNIQELETLARLGLPVKVFVVSNQGLPRSAPRSPGTLDV